MNMDTEVISAFLDDEAFDPADLGRALAAPGGRHLLFELAALRTLLRDEPIATEPRSPHSLSGPKWIAVGFLAASILVGASAAWLLPPLLERPADGPPTPDHVV